jgi:hypothetical protein
MTKDHTYPPQVPLGMQPADIRICGRSHMLPSNVSGGLVTRLTSLTGPTCACILIQDQKAKR